MQKIIDTLKNIIPAANIKTSSEDLKYYGKDWSMYFEPKPSVVVFPETEKQVADIIQWARQQKVALVPSGGRTGLSGGATAINGECVVSFEKMNKILEFNPIERTVRVQAGVITEELQKFAIEKGYFFPVDFAAKGSSQIGGNIATNAGGVKVVRYGLFRDWVTSMVVYTGKGDRLELNRSLIKNATGYDLRHLMIGSEGTLGLITEVELKLTTQPENAKVLLLGLSSRENILNIFSYCRDHAQLSACEYFSNLALDKVMAAHNKPKPLDTEHPDYLLLEIENTSDEKILPLFEELFNRGWVENGVISQSESQSALFWSYRELISESLSPFSPYKNDVSVRVSQVPEFLKLVDASMKSTYPNFELIWFGHVGDGNLHINILKPKDMDKNEFISQCQQSDISLFQIIEKLGGAISAEHGVGLIKRKYLKHTRSEAEIEIMKGIKKCFDPEGILNPGKVF